MWRAELPDPSIQASLQLFGVQTVGKDLGPLGIGDEEKGIIGHLEGDAGFFQTTCQPVMAVEIDLQAKRRPGGHPDVTEPKGLIDEVEVVMRVFAGGRFQGSIAFFLSYQG